MNSKLPRLTVAVLLLATTAFVAWRDRSKPTTDYDEVETTSPRRVATKPDVDSAAPSNDSSSGGDKLLVQAATTLERRSSVSARLRHQVVLGDSHLYGVGSYWQHGSGAELRVRLELQIAGQEASLLQISNSRFLWIDRQLPTGRNVSRVDLRKLRADPALRVASLDALEPGSASWSSMHSELIAHSGGLPSLLASLSNNFKFLPPQPMRLASQSSTEAQSIPVFAIVGHWKHEKLVTLLSRSQAPTAESRQAASLNSRLSTLNSLPNRLPQEVLVLVGQADLFPYRIEYRRMETPLAASSEAPSVPYQLSANPLVVLELADVAFDVSIAAGQFDYAPGDADWIDQTATVLERMHRERQHQVAVHVQADNEILPTR